MTYQLKGARLPSDKTLLSNIEMAAGRLCGKLEDLCIDSLAISDAGKSYLMGQVHDIRSTLRKFSYILSWTVAYTAVPLEDFVFVDHGGGVGILSLLAKELGLGTVIYNDLWEPYCKDACVIAKSAWATPADYYVHGDMDELLCFIQAKGLSCNGLGSYDVIEHIYDIDVFLKTLSMLSKGPLSVAMGSGANPKNILTRRLYRDLHVKAELGGRQKEWSCREDYCTEAYLDMRKKIVQEYRSSLPENEVEQLAASTRGLIVKDIHRVVDEYMQNGCFSYKPEHPTNTVNPHTGNWCERLHDLDHLRNVSVDNGFQVDILPGYHTMSIHRNILKRIAAGTVNCLITLLREKGLYFSPFYTVWARKAEQ